MEESYSLTDLLREDTKAMEFYDKLPDYVQEAIAQRPEESAPLKAFAITPTTCWQATVKYGKIGLPGQSRFG